MKKTQPQAIDATVWQEFLALDPDGQGGVVQELVDVFLTDTQQTIAAIRASVEATNLTVMKKSAHRLKSSAAGIGALRLSELLSELELTAESDRAPLQQRIVAIDSEFERVRDFLRGALNKRVA